MAPAVCTEAFYQVVAGAGFWFCTLLNLLTWTAEGVAPCASGHGRFRFQIIYMPTVKRRHALVSPDLLHPRK
jgi:hypothetical protein